jgi:hypothetical protein
MSMMRRIIFILAVVIAGVRSLSAQPIISYLTPDVCAPGIGVYVEFVAPAASPGVYGTDQVHLNTRTSAVRIECVRPADTSRLVMSPLVVSWSGRLISTTFFVPPSVVPNSSDWTLLESQYRIPVRVVVNGVASNIDTIYIVKPWSLGNVSARAERILGQGQLGKRSRRGAMIVDSLVLGTGTYTVSTNDCDPSAAGNQGFLPFTLIATGRITSIATADQTSIDASGVGLTGGPGGGGGGGGFSNFNLSNNKGTDGGDGFTGGGPGGYNFDRSRKKPGIGSGEALPAAGTTTRGSSSLNGVLGGEVTTSFENAGGGTGHPFGQSGVGCSDRLTCNTSGANGGGSGTQESRRGGGGGYGTKGESETGFTNGGFQHGNVFIMPLAGGSGGAGGNPELARSIGAGGGGGGGAISVHAQDVTNVTIRSRGGVPQRQALQGGCGSGGGVIVGVREKLSSGLLRGDIAGGSDATAGDPHLSGGEGRMRYDGPGALAGAAYNGATINARESFSRSSTLEGTRGSNGLYIWIRSENGAWQQVVSPSTTWAIPRYWALNMTWPGIDSVFYVVVAQEVQSPKTTPYAFEPAIVLSQSSSLVVRVITTAPIRVDSVDLGALTCRGVAVLDTVWVRNLTTSPMKINALSMVPPTEWSVVSGASKNPIPAGDSAFAVVRFSNALTLPAGPQNAELVVAFNDTSSVRAPMKADVGAITIDYIWRGLNRDTIDIGRVCIGKPITEPITIRKIGKGRLTMTSFAANDGAVITVNANTPIALNDSVSFGYVLVNFTAKQLGTYIVPIIVKFAECSTQDTIWVKHIGVESSMTFIGNGQFGDVRIGDRKEAIYEVRNTGTSDISIYKLPTLPAPFRVVSSNPVPPVDLKPGQAITMTVAFEPTAVGSYTHIMRLVGDSTFTSCIDSLNVPLAGRGVPSNVVISPTSLSFPVVAACDSVTECVTITNKGTTALTLLSPPVINGIHANSFSWKSGPNGDSVLAPGASITYCVTLFGVFGPDGIKTAMLSIRTDDVTLKTLNVGLNGQRTTVNVDGKRVVDLGSARVGTQASVVESYTNTSALPVKIVGVRSSSPLRTSAATVPVTIPAGGSQPFTFTYTCSAEESVADTIRFFIDEPCLDTVIVIVRARGGIESVNASQKINYGIIPECGSRTDSIVIVNNGSLPIDLVRFAGISGADASAFTCTNPTIVQNQRLNPNEQRVLYVTFDPSASTDGVKVATATVVARVNDTLVNINTELRGERRTSLPINPQSIVFGAVSITSTSTQTVTLFNTGVDDLTISAIAMKSGPASVFAVRSQPAAPLTLPPGGSLDVVIDFKPRDQLYYTDSIMIILDKPCREERVIAVAGTGRVVIDVVLKAPTAVLDPTSRDIRLPIIASISGEATRVDSVNIDMTLRMASSLFHVQGIAGGVITRNEVVGGYTEIDVSVREAVLDGSSSLVCELLGDATLGPIDSTDLTIDTALIDITSVTPRLSTQNGWLVSEVCEAGGKRLIALAGKLSVRALPNPIRDQATILVEAYERGPHTVRVMDAAGRVLWSTSWQHDMRDRLRELPLDTDQLSAGLYQIILESPTRRRVEPLSVVR